MRTKRIFGLTTLVGIGVLGSFFGLGKLAFDASGFGNFEGPGANQPTVPRSFELLSDVASSKSVSQNGFSISYNAAAVTATGPSGVFGRWQCNDDLYGTALVDAAPYASVILVGACGSKQKMFFAILEPSTSKLETFDGCDLLTGKQTFNDKWPNPAFYAGVIQRYVTTGPPPC